jgi:ubiquinone/menaquinone biosynthesis C-methylase UbiE
MLDPPLTPLAAAVLHVGVPERALQVSCGDGAGALFLAREFPVARIRGVDADADAVRAATARVGLDPEGRVAFKVGGPGDLPFPDDHFDLLAALDAHPAPGEAARVLRAGGYLVLARSRGNAVLTGPAGWLLGRRLRGRGFFTVRTETAGEGSFQIAKLGEAG